MHLSSQAIPAVAYVTLLDTYLIACYMLMSFVVAAGAVRRTE